MSDKCHQRERSSDTKQTPLVLDGISREDVTKDFLRGVHEVADDEGLSLENISVETH